MKLSFHAKPDALVYVPGPRSVGAQPRYVGRVFVPGDGKTHAANSPAADEPFVIDDADAIAETRSAAERLKRLCRRGDILPADEATARACGLAFVPLERGSDDEWHPATKKPQTRKASSVSEG